MDLVNLSNYGKIFFWSFSIVMKNEIVGYILSSSSGKSTSFTQ